MMSRWYHPALFVSCWLLAAWTNALAGAKEPAPKPGAADVPTSKYLRLERDAADELLSLQTSVVSFEGQNSNKEKLVVDLIGAVHVGERQYYETLNKLFADYDAVLYELVAPEGTVPQGNRSNSHPVNLVQGGLKSMLGLEHQLEVIDYSPENLVHADMSPDDFAKSMQKRGESFGQLFLHMMGQGIAQQTGQRKPGKISDAALLLAMFDRTRGPIQLKRVLAEQFEDLEGAMAAINEPNGSTLITERNKVALAELGKQIAQGKHRLAIFYGAGHLPDMAERLATDFKLQRTKDRWLSAWDLSEAATPAKTALPAAGAAAPAKQNKAKK